MTFVIVLDGQQGRVGAHEYAVAFSGSLQECRAKERTDGGFLTWLRSDFQEQEVEPKSLQVGLGNHLVGRILHLQAVKSVVWRSASANSVASAALFASGVAAGAALSSVVSTLKGERNG